MNFQHMCRTEAYEGKRFAVQLLAAIIALMLASAGLTQVNHTYPRTAVQHFGKAPAEWYARFDMVLIPWTDKQKMRDIKELNPNTFLIWVDGWTAYSPRNPVVDYMPTEAPEWFAVDSNGEIPDLNWGTLIDMSSLCPRINGQRFVDRHPEILLEQVDLNLVDGIGSDWCWEKPHGVKDIDLDRNGINDYDEHGKNWVRARWIEGVKVFIARLRDLIGPDKLIWVNSGKFHDWSWDTSNGLDIERQSGFVSWNSYWKQYRKFMNNAREPRILLMDVRPDWKDPIRPERTKNHFTLNRFMLTATMLGDGYYNYSPVEAGEHHFQAYYDEFDLDLGYPTQAAQKLANGCFVRFFDRGVSVVNPTGQPVTITDSDLRSAGGYNGPYYRFQGGQVPAVNNGEKFDTIELWGGFNQKSSGDILLGDGIILVSEPQSVVSDIFVDNIDLDSSPGQDPVQFTNGWQQTDQGEAYWSQNKKASKGWYAHAYTNGGNGAEVATYNLNIGVPGKYEVMEWHGNVSGGPMASNVPYAIHHSDGKAIKIVDQSNRQGQFNSLGTYSFSRGSYKVVVSNEANGLVVADMIKLVYRGEDGTLDTQAPSRPTGLKAEAGR